MQYSPSPELSGWLSPQFVYLNAAPVTLDINGPSDFTPMPSICNWLMECPGNKIYTCMHCEPQCRSVDKGPGMQEVTFRYLCRLNQMPKKTRCYGEVYSTSCLEKHFLIDSLNLQYFVKLTCFNVVY